METAIAKTYKIETERLVIRCYHPQDAPKLKASIDESIEHLLPWMPWAKNEPEKLDIKINRLRRYRGQFDLGQDYVFGIFNKSETELIGSTGLHTRVGEEAREIGYWIGAKHINQGYATETVRALMRVGFEIEQLARIEIHCDPKNIPSQNVPKKLGFHLTMSLKPNENDPEGALEEEMIWSMTLAGYKQSMEQKIALRAYDVFDREIELP